MIEIATLEQKEAFADLWRRCFGDSDVFTNWLFEKRFLPDFSTYIKKDDKIVCCMQAYPLHIWVRGKTVKGVMLCGVCTDKAYRRQGLMTELFSETMKMLRKKGFILVSHDRYFLDGCVDHILSLNRANVEVQKGNFSSWIVNFEQQQQFEIEENQRLKKVIPLSSPM